MIPKLTILQGDALEVLKGLAAGSVHCCVTSPPYDDLRSYGGYEWNFEGIAHEIYRVLCEGGVCCWNVGDSVVDGSETLTSFRQALYFKDSVGFRVHDTMIYEKTNFGHPERVRYHQLFEYIFVLSKGEPRCFNPIKDKPNAWAGTGPFGVSTMRQQNGDQKPVKRNVIADFGMRGNVWRCKTAGQENVCTPIEHPAVMPSELARGLILSWSNPEDTVLDPMCGSGTTCIAALELGRNAIGIELSPDYIRLAERRCATVTPGLALH
jgi:DNA modification methylase